MNARFKRVRCARTNVWLGIRFPGCLLLAALIAAAFPVNAVFIGAAATGSVVAFAAIYVFIYRMKQLRISWILADGLLLGYSLGTLNTGLRLALAGSTTAIQFSRPQEQFSIALAVSMLVSAVLFFVGSAAEKPIRIDTLRVRRSDVRFVWLGLAVELAAFATGGIGYMGTIADNQNHVTMLGEIAGVLGPALPAVTVFLLPKCRGSLSRIACWVLLAAALLCLIPQGRRVLLYAVLLTFVAFGVSAGRNLSFWKHVPWIAGAIPLLYASNIVFYAMRVSSQQAGSSRLSLSEISIRAAGILRGGRDAAFDQKVDENLRDRTFVLRYFSDLLDASWTHTPLFGRDLLFSAEMAMPSVLYPDKDSVRAIGMEENLANPEFGLYATDDANSILTTGVSDFGIIGVFVYPVALSLLISAFTRALARHLPDIVKAIAVFTVVGVIWRTEMAFSGYLVLCRDLIVLSIPLVILKLWDRTGHAPEWNRRRQTGGLDYAA